MQSAVRFIITLLFIGLIVIGVVFFSIIAVVPKDKLNKLKNKDFSTTTQQTTQKKGFFDLSFFAPFKVLIGGENTKQETVPEPSPIPMQNNAVKSYPKDLPPPQASAPLSKESLPSSVVKLTVNEKGFSPRTFTVRQGQQVALALENTGTLSHSFAFKDPLFAPVNLVVAPKETRGIQFVAVEKGEFVFRFDLPGHEDNGEVGTMIVE